MRIEFTEEEMEWARTMVNTAAVDTEPRTYMDFLFEQSGLTVETMAAWESVAWALVSASVFYPDTVGGAWAFGLHETSAARAADHGWDFGLTDIEENGR